MFDILVNEYPALQKYIGRVIRNGFIYRNYYRNLFFTGLFIFFTFYSNATTYYVSNSGDDSNTGRYTTQAWKTLAKINHWPLFKPGDKILFKRGDEWKGTIAVKTSGSSGNPITYGAYGTGDKPIVTGLTEITSWTDNGDGIYYATLDVPRLNIVTLDGEVVGMGRYPDSGYLNYESHNAKTSITDNELTGTPDWTGAEIGIRKYRWIIDRHIVTNHSGSTLTYNSLGDYGNNTAYSPVDGNGYFFQNDIKCLDDIGDWCYDAAANRIYMYFGGSPFGYAVKAGSQQHNLSFNSISYVTFEDIEFEGANIHGLYIPGAGNYVTFNNCDFTSQGGNGLYAINSSHITIDGGSMNNVLNTGIMFESNCDNITVDGFVLENIGNIPGANKSGDAAGNGIFIQGDNTIVQNSSVTNSGFNAIVFNGIDATIQYNLVDSFALIKDDAGGIYTYSSSNATISNNIVLNSIGAFEGCEAYYYEAFGKAAGIYLDDGVDNLNATVSDNTVAHGEWTGIMIHDNGGDTITNNVVYNHESQILLYQGVSGSVRNLLIAGNKFISKTASQKILCSQMNIEQNPSLFGTIDSNYYARPIDDNLTIQTIINGKKTEKSLSGWQAYSGQDANSNKSPVHILNENEIKFEYNASKASKSILLSYPMIDVKGTKYTSKVTLQPYTSVVLMKDPNPVD